MTKEEAKIVFLNRGYVKVNGGEIFDGDKWRQSVVVISEWLKEQEPSGDAISRQAVLDGLASIAKVKAKSDAQKSLMGRVMFFVEKLPSVTPQQKYGKWIIIDDCEQFIAKCSECGSTEIEYPEGIHGHFRYCPNCGAKMVEQERWN